ncbi:hypothetical protein [Sphingomonas faeni]|uniref:hypothetical protein n=1 Tax=Sphingomonas faeni TaxID=185950 RepID=UPI00334C08E0
MSGDERPVIAVLDGRGLGGDIALLAALSGIGAQIITIGDRPDYSRSDMLDSLYGGPSISDTIASLRDDAGWLGCSPRSARKPYRTSGREITFIDTPKPLSKRRARRLRGKVSA